MQQTRGRTSACSAGASGSAGAACALAAAAAASSAAVGLRISCRSTARARATGRVWGNAKQPRAPSAEHPRQRLWPAHAPPAPAHLQEVKRPRLLLRLQVAGVEAAGVRQGRRLHLGRIKVQGIPSRGAGRRRRRCLGSQVGRRRRLRRRRLRSWLGLGLADGLLLAGRVCRGCGLASNHAAPSAVGSEAVALGLLLGRRSCSWLSGRAHGAGDVPAAAVGALEGHRSCHAPLRGGGRLPGGGSCGLGGNRWRGLLLLCRGLLPAAAGLLLLLRRLARAGDLAEEGAAIIHPRICRLQRSCLHCRRRCSCWQCCSRRLHLRRCGGGSNLRSRLGLPGLRGRLLVRRLRWLRLLPRRRLLLPRLRGSPDLLGAAGRLRLPWLLSLPLLLRRLLLLLLPGICRLLPFCGWLLPLSRWLLPLRVCLLPLVLWMLCHLPGLRGSSIGGAVGCGRLCGGRGAAHHGAAQAIKHGGGIVCSGGGDHRQMPGW